MHARLRTSSYDCEGEVGRKGVGVREGEGGHGGHAGTGRCEEEKGSS